MDRVGFFIELGERFKKRREELNMSKKALSKRSGVHRYTILCLEEGSEASLMSCLQLEYALGVQGLISEVAARHRPRWQIEAAYSPLKRAA